MSRELQLQLIDTRHPLFSQVWQLREDVLRKPLALSLVYEDLSEEVQQDVIVALLEGELVGCLMLKYLDAQTIKIRQLAVKPAYQKQQIGWQMMQFAEKYALEKGCSHLELHGRMTNTPFFLKLGYRIVGANFLEVGLPHLKFVKGLQ